MARKSIFKKISIAVIALVVLTGLAAGGMKIHERNQEEAFLQTLQPALREEPEDPAFKVPVLTYHRLCSDEYAETLTEQQSLWTSESRFREQMKYLHDEGWITLTLDELYMWYNGDIEVPKKSVVITFDDGHYNVVKYGCPILREYGQNATIFVIGGDPYDVTDKEREIEPIGWDMYPSLAEEWPELNVQSHSYKIHRNSNVDPVIYGMSYDDIVADFDTQDELYGKFGYDFEYFAYPYGYYTDDLTKVLEDRGYKMAFLYGEAAYAKRENNPYLIPRIGIRGDQPMEEAFYRWLEY